MMLREIGHSVPHHAGDGPYIRWGIRADWPEIAAIDPALSEGEHLGMLRNRYCIGMACEARHLGPLIGFMVYELRRRSLHVLRMGGTPEARREMIGKLKGKLSTHRRRVLVAEVSEYDTPAIHAYALAGLIGMQPPGTGVIHFTHRIKES